MTSFPTETIRTNPLVVKFTAPNPGPKTLDGTNTYIVGRDQAYVIDPGPALPSYQQFLAGWLTKNGCAPKGILLTHAHPDHAPGAALLRDLLTAPVWHSAHPGMAANHTIEPSNDFRDNQEFAVDADTLHAIPTPGHSPDHVAFWLRQSRILFTGDTILGSGSTLIAPPEGDMAAYMRSLAAIRQLKPRTIAPGHGPLVLDPKSKIDEYITHRQEREAQLLDALRQGPATIVELVTRIYTDVDPSLHDLAAGSVEAQLVKLAKEGKVTKAGVEYRVAPWRAR